MKSIISILRTNGSRPKWKIQLSISFIPGKRRGRMKRWSHGCQCWKEYQCHCREKICTISKIHHESTRDKRSRIKNRIHHFLLSSWGFVKIIRRREFIPGREGISTFFFPLIYSGKINRTAKIVRKLAREGKQLLRREWRQLITNQFKRIILSQMKSRS